MRQNTFESSVGPRKYFIWDVTIEKGDTLKGFVDSLEAWRREKGHPRFFKVSVSIAGTAFVEHVTCDGLEELEILYNALIIAMAFSHV